MFRIFHQESRVTKQITSSVRVKSDAKEVDKKHEDVQMPKKEEEDFYREMLSAPKQKHPPLSLDKKSSSSEEMKCSERPEENTIEHALSNSAPQSEENTTEHTPPNSASQSRGDCQAHQSRTADPRAQQITHSRSGSISSTGTYNVESPKKSKTYSNSDIDQKNMKPKKVDSDGSSVDSSTGTYNVESPKMSKISSISNTDAPKIIKSKNLKKADSENSSASHSSGRSSKHEASSSTSHKKSVHSRSSAHTMKGVNSKVPEERPSTSHMAAALPLQPAPRMVSQ